MLRVKVLPISLNAVRCSSSILGKAPDLHKTNWKQDVVYLYQFKRSPVVPNLSPYCLKVETFLRAHNIKYEPLMSYSTRSKYGKLPFIELNGKQIADSDFILYELMKHFKINENLTTEQRGISRAVNRMLDQSTSKPLIYFRSIENADNFINPNVSGLPIPGFLAFIARNKYYKAVSHTLKADGIGRMKRDDVITILRRDLQALDDILGEKKFLLGILPTTPDFTMFGQLASTYYLPFRQPVTDLLDDEFPRLRQHIERMRTHYWKSTTTNSVVYIPSAVDLRSFQFVVKDLNWNEDLNNPNNTLYKQYASNITTRVSKVLEPNATSTKMIQKNNFEYSILTDAQNNYEIGKIDVTSLRQSNTSSQNVLAFVTVIYTAANASSIPSAGQEVKKLGNDKNIDQPEGMDDPIDFCKVAKNQHPDETPPTAASSIATSFGTETSSIGTSPGTENSGAPTSPNTGTSTIITNPTSSANLKTGTSTIVTNPTSSANLETGTSTIVTNPTSSAASGTITNPITTVSSLATTSETAATSQTGASSSPTSQNNPTTTAVNPASSTSNIPPITTPTLATTAQTGISESTSSATQSSPVTIASSTVPNSQSSTLASTTNSGTIPTTSEGTPAPSQSTSSGPSVSTVLPNTATFSTSIQPSASSGTPISTISNPLNTETTVLPNTATFSTSIQPSASSGTPISTVSNSPNTETTVSPNTATSSNSGSSTVTESYSSTSLNTEISTVSEYASTEISSTSTFLSTTPIDYHCDPYAQKVYQDILVVYDLSSDLLPSEYPNTNQTAQFVKNDLFSDNTYFISSTNPFFAASPLPFPSTNSYIDYSIRNFTGDKDSFGAVVNAQLVVSSTIQGNSSNINDALDFYIKNEGSFTRRFIPLTIIIVTRRDDLSLNAEDSATELKNNGAYIVTIGIGPGDFPNLISLASDGNYSFILSDFGNPGARFNMSTTIGSVLASICAVNSIPTTTTSTTTTTLQSTATHPSTVPPTTPFTCPNGGPYIQQSIAVVYNMIDAYGGLNNSKGAQLSSIIGNSLFNSSSYLISNKTQVLLRPYPQGQDHRYDSVDPEFKDIIDKTILKNIANTLLNVYQTTDVSDDISTGLAFALQLIEEPYTNGTVILFSQNCNGTGEEADDVISTLKENNFEIRVVTIGGAELSCITKYTTPDYVYNINDLGNSSAVQSVISQIQTSLLNKFPVCM